MLQEEVHEGGLEDKVHGTFIQHYGENDIEKKWVDIQGVEKKMMRLMKKMDKLFQFLIHEHRKIRTKSNVSLGESSGSAVERKKNTLIDVILSLQQEEAEGRIWEKFYLKI
ncbi:unnamed protein product [Ilex paraguariensis]|uniref:Uncharacterized protein n=1 Tax=Ilex paraguariensis TaxID=185542 RepID=A0ABC8SFM6_9AQUA